MVRNFPVGSRSVVPLGGVESRRKERKRGSKEYAPGKAAMERRGHSAQGRVHMRKGLVIEL